MTDHTEPEIVRLARVGVSACEAAGHCAGVLYRQALDIVEAFDAGRAQASGTFFAWVIEAPGQYYLIARCIGNQYDFAWAKDTTLALRFYSKEQADFTMMAVRQRQPVLFSFAVNLGDAYPTEHRWL